MTTKGGGWTIFQRRINGTVSFERLWNDYKTGFGDLNGEFWLGNEFLHLLTSHANSTLRIEVEDWLGVKVWAEYSQFNVLAEIEKYKLVLKGLYTGNDSNAMSAHNLSKFTTSDNDNDKSTANCAVVHRGGFWYKNCIEKGASPNGAYLGQVSSQDGIVWKSWKNGLENVKSVRMMLRPLNYGKKAILVPGFSVL